MPVPRQQVADPFCRVIQHPCQDIGEPSLWIDVVELGGGDERVEGSCPPAAFVGAGKGPVAAPDRDGTQLTLSGVVGHAQAAVVEEAGQRSPALEAVLDGLAGVAVLGHPGALLAQPGLQRDDERPASLSAHGHALRRRQAIDLALNGEQRVDAHNGLAGDRRLADPGQIEEFAPGMRPTSGLDDWSWLAGGFVEAVEPGIGVRLHQSGEVCQMLLGVLAATIAGIEERRRRRIRASKGPVVADIGPHPAGAGLALGQHRHGGVVGMDALSRFANRHASQRHVGVTACSHVS